MGLYGNANATTDNAALDVLESVLSAAHHDVEGSGYRLRLEPVKYDLLEILEWFEKDTREHFHMMRMIFSLLDGEKLNGFEINEYQARIDTMRKRIKGKLLFTRSLLADNDAKPKCLDKANHKQVCKCKNYAKFKLSEQEA